MFLEFLPCQPHLFSSIVHSTKGIQRTPSFLMQAYLAPSTILVTINPINKPTRSAPRRSLLLHRLLHHLKQSPSITAPSVTVSDPSRTNPTGRNMKKSMIRTTSACLEDQKKLHHKGYNVRSAESWIQMTLTSLGTALKHVLQDRRRPFPPREDMRWSVT